MAQSGARMEERAGTGRMLWSHRRRILLSTATLGLAAFLAGMTVPPMHRVSIRIEASPAVSARWTDAALRDLTSALPRETVGEPSSILAAWVALIDHASAFTPDVGASRLDDGTLVAWAESGDAAAARREAEQVAERLVEGSGVAAIAPPANDAPTRPVPSLEQSVEKAREALAAAEARVAEARAAVPAPDREGARPGSALDADRRAADEARRSLMSVERFARDLPNATPQDAPPEIRDAQKWLDWRDALSRRDKVAAQVSDLSRTLLDGHPRMSIIRLRLSDLEAELGAARERLSKTLEGRAATLREEIARLDRRIADGEARVGLDAAASERIRAAEAERDGAERTLAALEDALRAERQEAQARPAAPVAAQPAPPSRTVSETERRPTIWPIVAGSAAFGFLASALYTILGSYRHRAPPAAVPAPVEVAPLRRRRGALQPAEPAVPERRAAGPAADITSAEELIGGILASGISRLVLVPLSEEERSTGVEIVRRLALRGRQVALVDLCAEQKAARAMGVAPDALGVSDMIAGAATFAEIARRDFATQAEAFGAGQAFVGEAAFLAMERRNVLEFIERNYEAILVVCGDLPLDTVKALLTSDSALVVTVDPQDQEGIAAGVARLREAGLADMILADGRQLTP